MKQLTLFFLLIGFSSYGINDIAKVNELKEEGERAFLAGNYEGAIKSYSYIIDTLLIADEQVTINLAHAYFKTGNLEQAQSQYQKLVLSQDRELKSLSYQQLGALSKDPKTLEKALSYFKESIKSDPSNEDSRYNYEMVKKKLKDQSDQNQDQDNQDQENKEDQEDKEKEENQDQENKEQGDEGEKEKIKTRAKKTSRNQKKEKKGKTKRIKKSSVKKTRKEKRAKKRKAKKNRNLKEMKRMNQNQTKKSNSKKVRKEKKMTKKRVTNLLHQVSQIK